VTHFHKTSIYQTFDVLNMFLELMWVLSKLIRLFTCGTHANVLLHLISWTFLRISSGHVPTIVQTIISPQCRCDDRPFHNPSNEAQFYSKMIDFALWNVSVFDAVAPKWQRLLQPHKHKRSPLIIMLCGNTKRATDLNAKASDFKGTSCKWECLVRL